MNDFLYNELNKAWKTTSKILFKEEIGELKDYETWLKGKMLKPYKKSNLYFSSRYSGTKFINFKDINWNTKFEPLNINEIKDIDSIIEALKERFVYAGNVVLGKSQFVEDSVNISDSNFILNSNVIVKGKYIAYSSYLHNCTYVFGSNDAGNANFAIRMENFGGGKQDVYSQRLFESFNIESSSDIYYSANLIGVNESFFSFFLNGKSYVIGNIQLERERYYKIKEHLLSQIREAIISKKPYSLLDFISEKEQEQNSILVQDDFNYDVINNSFRQTSRIVLKKELELNKFEHYLKKNLEFLDLREETSPLTGNIVYSIPSFYPSVSKRGIHIGFEEQKIITARTADKKILENPELEGIKNYIKNISFVSIYNKKQSLNVKPPLIAFHSVNVYMSVITPNLKNSAYCLWVLYSSNVFGSEFVSESSYAIKARHSSNIQRAFEVDNVQNSSDIYFSHNVENIIEGMFNFNIKNLSYAIGNAKYEREKYFKLKSQLLEQIGDELETKRDLKWNIYNLGS